jgi:hypothetical protein
MNLGNAIKYIAKASITVNSYLYKQKQETCSSKDRKKNIESCKVCVNAFYIWQIITGLPIVSRNSSMLEEQIKYILIFVQEYS